MGVFYMLSVFALVGGSFIMLCLKETMGLTEKEKKQVYQVDVSEEKFNALESQDVETVDGEIYLNPDGGVTTLN
jgi:hypothetical protein